MTEVKHVFTIEITTEVIEPFTWGNCFYHTEDDKCLGCVGKKMHSRIFRPITTARRPFFSDVAKSYRLLTRNFTTIRVFTILGSGHVCGMVQDGCTRMLIPTYKFIGMANTNTTTQFLELEHASYLPQIQNKSTALKMHPRIGLTCY